MLAYLFLSKVAILHKAIHSQQFFHMCISVSQLVRNIGIASFAAIAVFACLRCLTVILVINMLVYVLY